MGLQLKPLKRRIDYQDQSNDVSLDGDIVISGNCNVQGTLTSSSLAVPAINSSASTFTVGADLVVTTGGTFGGNVTLTAAATPTLATTDTTNTVTNVHRSNDTVGQVGTTTAHALELIANGTARVAIASAGTINITGATTFTGVNVTLSGASTPTLTLTDTTNTVSLVAKSDDTKGTVGTSTAHSLVLQTGGTAALTIDSSQAATFAGALTVTGAATLSSTLALTGAATLSNTLTVNGTAITLSNATNPTFTVTDTTNTCSVVVQALNTTCKVGTTTGHDLILIAGNTTALTFTQSTQAAAFAAAVTAPSLTLTGASGVVLTLTDTTTPCTFNVTMADTTATLGTTTNHSLILRTNNATAVTIAGSGVATFAAAAVFTLGAQVAAVARTATNDGLTTGAIAAGTSFVAVTSASSANIITLPTGVVGTVIRGFVGANGHKLQTVASSNETINNQDSDGTKAAAIPANTLWQVECVAASTWILTACTNLGAVITAIVPA